MIGLTKICTPSRKLPLVLEPEVDLKPSGTAPLVPLYTNVPV